MRSKALKQFGAAVKHQRLKAKISQEELAELADLDRTYIGGVERGERNISLINIVKIAKALGLKPTDLLKAVGFEKK